MTTPEARAAALIESWKGQRLGLNQQSTAIAAAIAAAEREATERERRRCAAIAEIAATHTLGDPCRIIAKRIMIDPAKGE